jgi:hypothetical protein
MSTKQKMNLTTALLITLRVIPNVAQEVPVETSTATTTLLPISEATTTAYNVNTQQHVEFAASGFMLNEWLRFRNETDGWSGVSYWMPTAIAVA